MGIAPLKVPGYGDLGGGPWTQSMANYCLRWQGLSSLRFRRGTRDCGSISRCDWPLCGVTPIRPKWFSATCFEMTDEGRGSHWILLRWRKSRFVRLKIHGDFATMHVPWFKSTSETKFADVALSANFERILQEPLLVSGHEVFHGSVWQAICFTYLRWPYLRGHVIVLSSRGHCWSWSHY